MNPFGMSEDEFEAYEAWVSDQEAREKAARAEGEQLVRVDESVGPWIFTWQAPGFSALPGDRLPEDLDYFDHIDGIEPIPATESEHRAWLETWTTIDAGIN